MTRLSHTQVRAALLNRFVRLGKAIMLAYTITLSTQGRTGLFLTSVLSHRYGRVPSLS